MEKLTYSAPAITTLGSVHELTLSFNKVGPNADVYSANIPIVGSIVAI